MRKGLIVILLVAIVASFYLYFTRITEGDSPLEDPVNKNKLTEEKVMYLIDNDNQIDGYLKDIQKTPDRVINLNSLIRKIMYSDDLTEDQIEQLMTFQRRYFAEELLDKNEKALHLIRLQAELKRWKEAELKILGYEALSPRFIGPNSATAFIDVVFYTNDPETDIYVQYALYQDEDDQWVIYGWAPTEEFVISD